MQIAYAAPDATIRIHDTDDPRPTETSGDDTVVSVPGLRCSWPLWSPTGDLISFSGYAGGGSANVRLGMYATGIEERAPGLIYSNEPETGAIARGTPHYACWSPNGERLAFVAQTPAGLTLHVWDSDAQSGAQSGARPLLTGGPMYFSWSPDSNDLFIHSFTGHYLARATEATEPRRFPGDSTQYMSPSWSLGGGQVAFFIDAERGRQRLVVIDLEDYAIKVLAEFPGIAAIAWRPRHPQIALARQMIRSTGFYSGISLIDYPDGVERRLTDDPVLAFFWSPDGSRLAYVTSSEGAEGSIRLCVIAVDAEEAVYLPDFKPSQEQLTQFMFFDQYAQSMPMWSPDGERLLIFGVLGYFEERTELTRRDPDRAILLDPTGAESPRELARGHIGSWGSWAPA